MADRFESCSELIQEFNKNYGLDFDLNAFDLKVKSLSNSVSDSALNDLYKSTFVELYGKTFGNCVDGLIDPQKMNPAKFFGGFENVMAGYRAVCREEGGPYPAPIGGWTKHTEPLESAVQAISDIPTDRIEYAAQRYQDGELSISDMKKHEELLNGAYEMIPKEDRMKLMATVHCYAEALKKVNESRTPLQKIGNLLKHSEERRAIEEFEKRINSVAKIEGGENSATAKLEEMRAFAEGDDVANMKNAVIDLVGRMQAKVAEGAPASKEKMSIDEAVTDTSVKNTEKVAETKTPALGKTNV